MIEAVDLERTYKLGDSDVGALRGVSLSVAAGDYVAITGPSGSGKSTLMHVLGALDRPTAGLVRIDGRDVNTLSDGDLAELRNATIGFVFQSFALLARTSAVDNVAMPLLYRGMRKSARRKLAVEALEKVGLAHRLDHRPNQLSGGEQQRVAIARALVGDPKVVFADEPTGNLDTRNGEEVMKLLGALNADAGVAIVLVTHEPDIAAHASRQIQIRDGRIAFDSAAGRDPAAA
ncbi:ABC transporter ATP-binding protein [Sporichthya sp.]|uniref:ABC transporter ATP-binding protein n=1 Tax=Sporichthya sp. TaxID=65475 RepID=UPI00184E27B2|nr:ABC transporter ATP-binding protein [Sporichthya sp.]MBA3743629.1 ABC transporter ATP-binding protein [Sporichthya sp.]